jgi:DNA-directed RNA polymerase specialized sigma24 family protein
MSAPGSVTHWIGQLKAGDQKAAQKLWEGYFQRMVGLARKKLQGTPRRAADEEDVALSAFDSFCRGAEQGRFPRLDDRHDLWQLLFLLTIRKAVDLLEHEGRKKRGGGEVRGESALANRAGRGSANLGDLDEFPLNQIIGPDPSPELVALMAEQCQCLLASLADLQLRQIALWKMEGFTTEEIATKLGCVPRTIDRKLQVIRHLWSREPAP